MKIIEIEARRRDQGPAPTTFDVYVAGRYLCTSATPFRDSALLLLAEGHAPSIRLSMCEPGSVMSLQAPLGYWGTRDMPRFVPWAPFRGKVVCDCVAPADAEPQPCRCGDAL